MSEAEIVFWSIGEYVETLYHTTITEVVEEWADSLDYLPLPETVEVTGWARETLPDPEHEAVRVLDDLLEWYSEEYGNPDESFVPTDEMKVAARTFVAAVHADYEVWACRPVERRTVRVADHVPAEWLVPPATPTTEETDG